MRFRVDYAFDRERHALVLLLVSVLALQAASAPQPYQPSPLPDRVILNWTEDPSTGFSVTWRTDTTVAGPWRKSCRR